KVFADKATINIDNKNNNTRFGKINLLNTQASSSCEIVVDLIKNLNWAVDQDIATNLYAGIKVSSSNFQAANVSALTFEASAWCLKNGAQKNHMVSTTFQSSPNVTQPISPVKQSMTQPTNQVKPMPSMAQPQTQPQPQPSQQTVMGSNNTVQPPTKTFKPGAGITPTNTFQRQNKMPKPPFSNKDNEDKGRSQPPPDWFKPKIYKGNKTV
ncbi:bifunctional oligoribonuclease/PAP phosphatase NrnA, partial [Patescibacteria group bacterium]